MKVHFLGTAAAEGFPNVYCHCQTCQTARERGGRDIRTRCSVIVDDVLKVDHGPDSYMQALRDDIDMSLIQDILMTHTHFDHLCPGDIISRMKGYAHGIETPLNIYGNELALYQYRTALLEEGEEDEQNQFHRLKPFQTVQIGEASVTPLYADHDQNEMCLLYFIEKKGKSILYGHDTGWFPEETWTWLETKKIDMAILDCTTGQTGHKRGRGHMSVETVIEVHKMFQEKNILNENARIVVTHFSHNGRLLHDDLEAIFKPYGVEVAYDGMVLNL
ncbi:MAG TPA: MBL fold metallo-hydrolase [Bacillota bacterium]|nr:MBL fold metallo-hydrolase [Bacillota bacterium]